MACVQLGSKVVESVANARLVSKSVEDSPASSNIDLVKVAPPFLPKKSTLVRFCRQCGHIQSPMPQEHQSCESTLQGLTSLWAIAQRFGGSSLRFDRGLYICHISFSE